jgi:transposase
MAAGDLLMSGSERERAFVVRQSAEGRLSQREASERLGIGVRQFKRLVHAWRGDGDAGLVSRQRGRPSHRRMSEALRSQISDLLRDRYADFGATLAAEKLLERDGIKVSAETVRRVQIGLGLWRPKTRRVRRVFQLRERRPRFGELVQIDGSPHDWFEGRAPRCTLIVFIDDATGRLTALRFAPVESAGRIWRRCATRFWRTAARWPSTRIAMASFGSMPKTLRVAMARRNSAGLWTVWTLR